MSIYQTHFDATFVKCLVTTKINVVDSLHAATAVSLNIVDHMACVTNHPNVSTAQVITLQTQSNAHNGRKSITIHHECPCRIEISHRRGQKFNQGRGLRSPWLNSDPEGEISLSYMDMLMMDSFSPTFQKFFVRT